MGGIVSGITDTIGDVAGGLGDIAGDVAGGIGNIAGNALSGVAKNPIGAITGLATGNYAPLIGSALGGALGGGGGGGYSSSLQPGYFSGGGGGTPIIINTGSPTQSGMNATQFGSALTGILGGLGGILQNTTNADALKEYANRITQAGQQAQQQTQFRPVGITNTFGTSKFTVDPTTGQMTAAGYELSPMLQEYQNAIMGANRQSLSDAAALQKLGQGYIGQSPQDVAAQALKEQYALLAPSREQAWANLANQDYNRGTMGLKVAQGGGLQAANPYAAALANAQARQDLELAANARQLGQQNVKFGQGLLSSAYDPFAAGLTTAKTIEGLAQQPFGLSADLAKLSQGAGYQAGRLGVDAATQAGGLLKQANQINTTADILGKLGTSATAGNVLGSLFSNTDLGRSLGNWMGGATDNMGSQAGNWYGGLSGVFNIPDQSINNPYADILGPGETWMGE